MPKEKVYISSEEVDNLVEDLSASFVWLNITGVIPNLISSEFKKRYFIINALVEDIDLTRLYALRDLIILHNFHPDIQITPSSNERIHLKILVTGAD
jgi:hypothetical protein